MNWLLRRLILRVVRTGTLKVTGANGKEHIFGDGSGEPVHALIRTRRAERAMALNPSLAVPEAYMNGELEFAEGDILQFLKIAFTNMQAQHQTLWSGFVARLSKLASRFQQINTATRSKRNVHHHYDLSGEMYRLFLDEDMQYSCAYFERPDVSLDEAQRAKKRHVAAKLDLKPGHTVLDIGSGWGGLGLYLARRFEADIVGVTLSTEQHQVAVERAASEGLEDHAHFELRDYRDLKERFDRIVSVGMFEHVGINHYATFFDKCATLLKPDGTMLVHTIGRTGRPQGTNAFIRKYIFPGGYIPALSDVMPPIENSGLMVTDVEILRLHYADTLRHWRERFVANRDKAIELYDERFARMWEFYLAGSEASFRYSDLVVFQVQLTRRNDVLPITRDYIAKREKALAMRDLGDGAPARKSSRSGTRRKKHSAGED